MKILVADDHALFRDGLRHVLRQLADDVELIEAGDHATAAALVTIHPDADLMLVDLAMPGRDPFAALATLLDRAQAIPIVVLSANEDPRDIRRALDAGVVGYIPKRESAAVMLGALRLVLAGGVYVPALLLQSPPPARRNGEGLLTQRQLDVLQHLMQGKSNKEIGRELDLSEATVKVHVTAIFRSLNVQNRTQAAHTARTLGLLHRDGTQSS